MIVKPATAGMVLFDIDHPLSSSAAAMMKANGFDGSIRYLPRTPSLIPGNLTSAEVNIILDSGLALGAVQHCPLPGWEPSAELGGIYGQYACKYASEIELGMFMNIWLDLEGVSAAAKTEDVIAYCNAWFYAVQAGNFVPGIYVGYQCGLTPEQLYSDLKFQHYWAAYNYTDGVAKRGIQIQQYTAKTLNGVNFDPDVVRIDNLGGLPIFLFAA